VPSDGRNSTQLVGACGEKIVEAELLRRGWLPANVNATVTNAARFDIFAQKGDHIVAIQVKSCGPTSRAFSFSRFPPAQQAGANEFTVLVKIGETRQTDQVFVIPSHALHGDIEKFRSEALQSGTKDIGMWDLHLSEAKKSHFQSKYGFAAKWSKWRDNWQQLEREPANVESAGNITSDHG
jgi:hypothetical protein